MPRRKLPQRKDESIQVQMTSDDKRAFDAYCYKNGTTMSAIVRQEIAAYIAEGKKILIEEPEFV